MKLTFLGSGSAFTVGKNYHSNILLENDNDQKKLLIDCGSDVRHALYELGLSYNDIDSVFISHLHSDHVGGLEWLAFTTKFAQGCQKSKLFISADLVHDLWEHVLRGGLCSIEENNINLSTYFDVETINHDSSFVWSGLKLKQVKSTHVMSGDCLLPSYGLFFTANGTDLFITGDIQFTPEECMPYYKKAAIIFQDCELSKCKSGVHAHYDDLITLPKEIKNKMWLYHYNGEGLPNPKKEGFRGFVMKGQSFNFNDKQTLS
jgi:ribonuclease BN (tRNA processing enzyme)